MHLNKTLILSYTLLVKEHILPTTSIQQDRKMSNLNVLVINLLEDSANINHTREFQ